MLWILIGGMAIGIVIGYLLRGASPDKTSPDPSHARAIPILALGESADKRSISLPSASTFPIVESAKLSEKPFAKAPRGDERPDAHGSLKHDPDPESLRLLDRARNVFFDTGRPLAAFALLAQHERLFPAGQEAANRRELARRFCATAAARSAIECSNVSTERAPK